MAQIPIVSVFCLDIINNTHMIGDKVDFGVIGEESTRSQEVENIIKVIFEDVEFAKEALPVIPQNEFANLYYRLIIGMMKDFQYSHVEPPTYDDIVEVIKQKYQGYDVDVLIAYVEDIKKRILPPSEVDKCKKEYKQYFKKALYAKLANYMFAMAPYFNTNELEIVNEITERYNQFIEYWNSNDLFQGNIDEGIFTED